MQKEKRIEKNIFISCQICLLELQADMILKFRLVFKVKVCRCERKGFVWSVDDIYCLVTFLKLILCVNMEWFCWKFLLCLVQTEYRNE